MMKLHTLALCLGVFSQAAGAFVNPAFTARVGTNYLHRQPVLFDDVITNVGNMYNRDTRTLRIPGVGTYWMTFNIHPGSSNLTLELYINDLRTKFYADADGCPSSKSGGFFLRYGDTLAVYLLGRGVLEQDTLWSVVYIGWGAQVFLGQINSNAVAELPVPFSDVITSQSNSVLQDPDTKEFTVLVDGLHFIHLSAVGDINLVLMVQLFSPVVSPDHWISIMRTFGEGIRPSSVGAFFRLLKGDKLRVMRPLQTGSPGLPWAGTTFSIFCINPSPFVNTTAFTGETRDAREYRPTEPVKFDFASININNCYNTNTSVYTVPSDSVYIVSLRPVASYARGKPMTFALRNATHEVFRVSTGFSTPAGVSAAVYLRAGDMLKVFAYTPCLDNTVVELGSIFSIANL